jgi:hypothetical protein
MAKRSDFNLYPKNYPWLQIVSLAAILPSILRMGTLNVWLEHLDHTPSFFRLYMFILALLLGPLLEYL